MAVKGSATVTLTSYRDTQSVTRYYKLQTAGSSAPSKPTTKPPSSDWTDLEPDCDISKELYFCDLTIFSNGEWEYSSVSKSSSYEAAKEAYNKAQNASETLKAESARIDSLETGKANIADLNAEKARIDTLETNKADISTLNAGIARIDTLEAGKADIDLANVNNAWITNGVIKDASIANEKVISVSANKLTAGTIDASKITVTNLNADNITVGTINGARIGNNSIDLNKLSQEVPTKEYLDSVEQKLQGEIDGAIETFTVSEIPTLNNEPAVNWTTDDIKSTHVGDLCYVVNKASDNDGFCYRFQYNGTAYSWALIKDNDVTKAIQDIAELDGKVTQFKTDYTSKVSEIDGGIESLKSRTTTIETTYSTKTYTDNKASDALTSANSYADGKATSTLTSAKSYTDSTASSTLGEAKSYTDTATADMATTGDIPTKVSELTNDSSFATTTQVSNAKSEAISTASADATSKANSALDSAKSYTDSVEIGGRNLVTNSVNLSDFSIDSSTHTTRTITDDYCIVNRLVNANKPSTHYGIYKDIPVIAGEEYTVSCTVKEITGRMRLGLGHDTSQWTGLGVWDLSVGRFSRTVTAPSNATFIRIYIAGNDGVNGGSVTVSNIKLEKGNKATDWTPAPEDVDASISEAQTAADNAQADIDTISDKTRSGYIEILSGTGFVQSTKTEDGGTAEIVVYGKSVQDGTPTPEVPVEIQSVTNPWIATSKNGVAFSKEVSCKVSVPVKTDEYFGYKTLYGSAQSQIMLMDKDDKYIDWWTAFPEEKTKQYVYSSTIYGVRFYNTNTSGIPILFRNVTQGESYVYSVIRLTDIILRSTPDGTRDRLFKDTDGLWKIERNCAYISSYNSESITTSYYSNTGELSTGASVVYALEVPTYETLPDSIQAELNALTTYNSITNVIVSDGVTPDIDVLFWTRDYRAKNMAENAQISADNAQTTANEAKAKAEAAQTAVSTKVETSVFNTLKNTVDENSANITSLTETVTTKADSSTVTALSNTVNKVKQTADANSSSISKLTTTVNSKADGSKVTALENKTSTIEQNLSGVTTRVTNLESENDGLDTRLTTAESKITDDAIVSTVTSSKTYKDALSGKVDTSVYNTKMEQLDDSISLKATATDVYTKTQANAALATAKSEAISSAKSYTDTATTDMATKEYVTKQGYLTVTSDAITSKVSKNEVISAINQTAESVGIHAEKINLRGAVTISSLDNSLQTTINNKAETSALVSTDESIRQDIENNYYSHTELGQSLSFNETDGLIIQVPNSPYETRISNTQIEFRYQGQPVAYINGEILVIPKSMMLDEMMVGNNKWSWRIRDNGNLQLKWIG